MRVGQQSSASVNGVGEGGEGSVHVGQQSSSVASVNGVGEGGEGSVYVGQQSSASVNGVAERGREVCVWVNSRRRLCYQ